jgi:hypothetical protein
MLLSKNKMWVRLKVNVSKWLNLRGFLLGDFRKLGTKGHLLENESFFLKLFNVARNIHARQQVRSE